MGRLKSIARLVILSILREIIPADAMPNPNYLKGRRLEYEVKKHYEGCGYVVSRSAGSKGPFDLIALRMDQILLVQCKVVSTVSEAARLNIQWKANPPFKPFKFPATQVLAVKIKGSSEIMYQYI